MQTTIMTGIGPRVVHIDDTIHNAVLVLHKDDAPFTSEDDQIVFLGYVDPACPRAVLQRLANIRLTRRVAEITAEYVHERQNRRLKMLRTRGRGPFNPGVQAMRDAFARAGL